MDRAYKAARENDVFREWDSNSRQIIRSLLQATEKLVFAFSS